MLSNWPSSSFPVFVTQTNDLQVLVITTPSTFLNDDSVIMSAMIRTYSGSGLAVLYHYPQDDAAYKPLLAHLATSIYTRLGVEAASDCGHRVRSCTLHAGRPSAALLTVPVPAFEVFNSCRSSVAGMFLLFVWAAWPKSA